MLRAASFVKQKISVLGPGIVMAGAAVGVSHLVQSTRAGADYGFSLVLVVILVNMIKYPFFYYGHKYAAITGQNLLAGYLSINKFYLQLFLLLNLFSGVISIAGVVLVTSSLISLIFKSSVFLVSIFCVIICVGIIAIGNYRWLNNLSKVIMFALSVCTVISFFIAAVHNKEMLVNIQLVPHFESMSVGFLIALFGWMPAPLEMSVWQSLWVLESKITYKEAITDFKVGYFLTIFLAVIFIGLGALVMHGSGETFSNNGTLFAMQFIDLYGKTLGDFARPLIILAAICTMFSTSLTVIDAYPRTIFTGLLLLYPKLANKQHIQLIILIIFPSLSLILIAFFIDHFKLMVDFATSFAFLLAPIIALLNFKLMSGELIPADKKLNRAEKIFSMFGIAFLSFFALLFLISVI